MRSRVAAAAVVGLACWAGAARAAEPEPRPLAPGPAAPDSPVPAEQAARHFVLDEGLRIELVAAEPAVVDPVAMAFDADGRLWVAEYRDYPLGPPEGQPPRSRVVRLEDADGDGRYETSHLFADGLPFVNGLLPWDRGLLVTSFSRVVYLEDADGDGRAERQETWFSGFSEQNSQLFVNHPRFGLDNRVYVSTGLRGGLVKSERYPDHPPLDVRANDLCFDPRNPRAEPTAGVGQFGNAFDDAGHRFMCSNRNPWYHAVLPLRYATRNPRLAVSVVTQDVAASGDAARVFPLIEAWTTSILHAGQFTAACGLEVFRGDALGDAYYGNGFTCEPTGSLVHREIPRAAGASFLSRPADEGREFLASRDPWFKPVNVKTGPDGALYVVDMYRAVIEHPQFMPEELRNRPDLRAGDDRGRIWRIVPREGQPTCERPQLSRAASAELVPLLARKNAWWRETAARLLYERQDRSVVPQLIELLDRAPWDVARVQALWAIDGLGGETDEVLLAALGDASPRVVEQAVRLAEPRLAENADLRAAVLRHAATRDGGLRFQVALSLGGLRDEAATAALAQLALSGADDPWIRRAVATGLEGREADVFARVVAAPVPGEAESLAARRALVAELAALVGAGRDPQQIAAALAGLPEASDDPPRRVVRGAALLGLAQGARGRGLAWASVLAALPMDSPARAAWDAALDDALRTVADRQADEAARLDACDLLAFAALDRSRAALIALVDGPAPQPLVLRAVAALAQHNDAELTGVFLDQLGRQTPGVRGALVDALLARPERVDRLLAEIEAGRLRPTVLDPLRAGRLAKHPDAKLRARAAKVLAALAPADRTKVFEDYRPILAGPSDPKRGKLVFEKNCATCHRIGGLGTDVGPSIADLRTKTPEQVLMDIVQPNRAIDNNFLSYTVQTADGQSLVGIIVAETATGVTLRLPEGKNVSLLKEDIEFMQSNGVSLMPEGLERNVPPQDMADVIAFVKNWRYLDPAVLKPSPLPATPAGASSGP